ncbi:hypothetical protein B0H21DRAFT_781032 [Amylocystis lapponica]|nr:hypothetical protein B0H21DRAFT_781032 [Amylocystis lapponica]
MRKGSARSPTALTLPPYELDVQRLSIAGRVTEPTQPRCDVNFQTTFTTCDLLAPLLKIPQIPIAFMTWRENMTSGLTAISHRTPSSTAVGHTVDFPRTYNRDGSESPSPPPSLDIRMPTGLGRRASAKRPSTGSQQGTSKVYRADRRTRSISSPDLPVLEHSTWPDVLASLDEDLPSESSSVITHMPPELLTVIFSAAAHSDIASLACVSRGFLAPALRALYGDLDLRKVDDERVGKCISVIASKRIVGGYVRKFACRSFPSAKNGATHLTMVTLAIALTNMHQLQSLTLPQFEASLLFHTTFRLRRLTVLCESIPPDEFRDFISWLVNQPALVSLSLPNLVLNTFLDYHAEGSGIPPHDRAADDSPNTPVSQRDTTPRALPSHILPRLAHFYGPPSFAAAIVPGRPIESIVLNVNTTLYDGLRPSAVMSALTRASVGLQQLSIKSASPKIDARTLERVLMSAGAELGNDLQSLDVHWVLEDEMLYKQILAVLPRFRALRTLRLYRDSPPPPPCSPPPRSPPPASPPSPMSPVSPSALLLPIPPSPLPSSSSSRPSSAGSIALDMPLPRAHERSHLVAWSKCCPSLRTAVFLSGAEWHVNMRLSSYVSLATPTFAFVGVVPAA